MDLVGLVSGGKDSIYNILECTRRGHRVIALANLYPAPRSGSDGVPPESTGSAAAVSKVGGGFPPPVAADASDSALPQELDSFMLQTVGHNCVPAIAECMRLPLVRHPTHGQSLHRDLHYPTTHTHTGRRSHARTHSAGSEILSEEHRDEVEDLYALLAEVKARFPSVQGVAVGAIQSHYQRLRVEHVCARLGLIPVAFVWQREQRGLLQDMIDAGMDAILVKVAAVGLTERMLGRGIRELQPALLALGEKYELNVCGEGGEYESLVVDAPMFSSSIIVDASKVVTVGRGVAYLHILEHHAHPKATAVVAPLEGDASAPAFSVAALPKPFISREPPPPARDPPAQSPPGFPADTFGLRPLPNDAPAPTAAEQVVQCMEALSTALELAGACFADIAFVHLYLAAMHDFGPVNEAYCRYFGVHPPSRSAVQCSALPGGWRVAIDALVIRGSGVSLIQRAETRLRDTLHVATLSDWAPLCIGPYCQANIVRRGVVFAAGQIALHPSTMQFDRLPTIAQLHRSLLHAARVLAATQSAMSSCVSLTLYAHERVLSQPGMHERLHRIATQWVWGLFGQWQSYLEQLRRARRPSSPPADDTSTSPDGARGLAVAPISDDCNERQFYLGRHAHDAPGYVRSLLYSDDDEALPARADDEGVLAWVTPRAQALSPVHIIPVTALPRDADVEVEVIALRDEVRETEDLQAQQHGGLEGNVVEVKTHAGGHASFLARDCLHYVSGHLASLWVVVKCDDSGPVSTAAVGHVSLLVADALAKSGLTWDNLACVRVHASGATDADLEPALLSELRARAGRACAPAIQVVPVPGVADWPSDAVSLGTGLVVHALALA